MLTAYPRLILAFSVSFPILRPVLARGGALSPLARHQPLRLIPILAMAIKRTSKKKLITKHQTHKKDTGSPHVQIAILSKEIALLTKHLQEHKGDHSARKGLLGKVARRRTLLNYLRMNSPDAYQKVLDANKLKK